MFSLLLCLYGNLWSVIITCQKFRWWLASSSKKNILFSFFKNNLFLRERAHTWAGEGQRERERERERIPSRFHTVSSEADVGLDPVNWSHELWDHDLSWNQESHAQLTEPARDEFWYMYTTITTLKKQNISGLLGWLSQLGVWLELRSWASSSWVWNLRQALCWQLRAWSLLQILCLPLSLSLPQSCSISVSQKLINVKKLF